MSQLTLGNKFAGIQRSLLLVIGQLFEKNIIVHYEKDNTYITKDGEHQSLDKCDFILPFLTSCQQSSSVHWIIHIDGKDNTYFEDKYKRYHYMTRNTKTIQ